MQVSAWWSCSGINQPIYYALLNSLASVVGYFPPTQRVRQIEMDEVASLRTRMGRALSWGVKSDVTPSSYGRPTHSLQARQLFFAEGRLEEFLSKLVVQEKLHLQQQQHRQCPLRLSGLLMKSMRTKRSTGDAPAAPDHYSGITAETRVLDRVRS